MKKEKVRGGRGRGPGRGPFQNNVRRNIIPKKKMRGKNRSKKQGESEKKKKTGVPMLKQGSIHESPPKFLVQGQGSRGLQK